MFRCVEVFLPRGYEAEELSNMKDIQLMYNIFFNLN